ncbi:GNAT family N-acetyltransferase [Mesobacillus foraminis]|uniref:RimJ/RimL family protein N-acetyltransferase n=1 Tax=Mesobacillus foraminis TaxID=279826 RepID=A0A4R2BLW9_9BACI|nr:GNAT family protein [Mesobacillus foraminis]TCN27064.1 RimJ/RimL family protein N-acetyltransferase [Mesobacillus foraminis]
MIYLKKFEPSDFSQLIDWIDSPELNLQWGGPAFDYPLTKPQLEAYIKDANHPGSSRYIYKVVLKESGRSIGHISLANIDLHHRSARIGKVLIGDKTIRGRGIGQLMIKEVLKKAFEDLNLHRVSLGVFDFNDSAIACYEKAGFRKEGLLRDCRKLGNEYWSMWEMSILESEYQRK